MVCVLDQCFQRVSGLYQRQAIYKELIFRIDHECVGGIEKNRPKDYRLTSRSLPSDDITRLAK